MARVTAQEYAEKWGRRLKGATEDIRRGISRVTEAPGVAAARAADAFVAGVQQSVADRTWQSQVSAVTLEEWKSKAITKGTQRIASGVDAAQPGQVQMAERLLSNVDAAAQIARRLPKATLEDRINRMTTFAREMSARKLRRPGAA